MKDYIYFLKRDAEYSKRIKKLRDAWNNYYTPFQLSQSKLISKVQMRIAKGKFPSITES